MFLCYYLLKQFVLKYLDVARELHKRRETMRIITKKMAQPVLTKNIVPVELSDETMAKRKKALLMAMEEKKIDTVVIYGDREHGSNFEYFTGFIPRFEEALLVIHQNGQAFLLLGNENTKMVQHARLEAQLIHVPFFSLPNQPMEDDAPFKDYLIAAGIEKGQKVAVIGWKNFTSAVEENQKLFDLPYFIVDSLKQVISEEAGLVNGANLLIGADNGIRTINNANELAHYEYGATLAGMGILTTLNSVELGKTELELAGNLAQFGQPNTITTICATGTRFTNATLYPRNKQVELGDTFSTSVGFKGGLSSRAAYVAKSKLDLPEAVQDYEEKVAKPYYTAFCTWLEKIHIGLTAGKFYEEIEAVLPQSDYHWELNPGHFVADEEWMSSPFSKNSTAEIKSGQLFQIDIIPRVAGYGGASCEDGVAIADSELRSTLETEYPQVWERIVRRRTYLKDVLGIKLREEILPLNDVLAYYRPYLLDRETAFCKE